MAARPRPAPACAARGGVRPTRGRAVIGHGGSSRQTGAITTVAGWAILARQGHAPCPAPGAAE
jgi:hypothetical protein